MLVTARPCHAAGAEHRARGRAPGLVDTFQHARLKRPARRAACDLQARRNPTSTDSNMPRRRGQRHVVSRSHARSRVQVSLRRGRLHRHRQVDPLACPQLRTGSPASAPPRDSIADRRRIKRVAWRCSRVAHVQVRPSASIRMAPAQAVLTVRSITCGTERQRVQGSDRHCRRRADRAQRTAMPARATPNDRVFGRPSVRSVRRCPVAAPNSACPRTGHR